MGRDEIRYKVTQDAVEIVASGSDTSDIIDFGVKAPAGFFSVQVSVSGNGEAKIEYLLSNNGVDFLTPEDTEDIINELTAASGPGGDGEAMYSFSPMVATHMKIKVTETGGANSVTITVTIAYQ